MQFVSNYKSKLGRILLASDEKGLCGLWFEGQKHFASSLIESKEKETDFIKEAKEWLNIYFKGVKPSFTPQIHFIGTEFQISVWKILEKIPYGTTHTYGQIAAQIAKQKGINKMSAQAVGSAVGKNPVSIIIPCHRIIGTNNSLTGYAAGIDKKLKLLELEGVNIKNLILPKK